jgi:hypothetical protein
MLTGKMQDKTVESTISDPGVIQTSIPTMQKTQNHYQSGSIVGTSASYTLVPCCTEMPAYFQLWLKQRLILPKIKFLVQKITTCFVHFSRNKKPIQL